MFLGHLPTASDETEKLHDALVLAQVLMSLEQEHVSAAVAPANAELSRPLLGSYIF